MALLYILEVWWVGGLYDKAYGGHRLDELLLVMIWYSCTNATKHFSFSRDEMNKTAACTARQMSNRIEFVHNQDALVYLARILNVLC